MVLMKKGSIAAAFVAASMCFGPAAFSQQATASSTETAQAQAEQKFSDEELKSFIAANTKATELQKQSREAVVAAIEENNLTSDRFNELVKAHQQKKLDAVAKNPEEVAAFSKAAQAVVKIQPETKTKIEQAIKDEGLTVEKYETILQAYEKDEAVQESIRRIVHADK
ncbi:hypothetical protein GCM10023188_17200 [Pontibacter saemangeumensis]|uniref:DUF4168 domain-containing protein n=1 Tax=Pontibacter saemangeumensis TaxID=1084525 RepID=A0ABP8LKJ6_9BACT